MPAPLDAPRNAGTESTLPVRYSTSSTSGWMPGQTRRKSFTTTRSPTT
jgi:hypothetical protein